MSAWINKKASKLVNFCVAILFFKYILLIMLLQLSYFFSPLIPLCPAHCLPHYSTPLVQVHGSYQYISSLVSPFPILFLISLCLFCTYQLCFIISRKVKTQPKHTHTHAHTKICAVYGEGAVTDWMFQKWSEKFLGTTDILYK